jgi:5-methylcytosine-specific restriction endonuclease McrA
MLIIDFNIMATKKEIQDAWEEARTIRGKDPKVWRKDKYGNKIRRGSYGTVGDYGWELDHKFPKSKGGSNKDKNMQPLHWEENRKKSDKLNHK